MLIKEVSPKLNTKTATVYKMHKFKDTSEGIPPVKCWITYTNAVLSILD